MSYRPILWFLEEDQTKVQVHDYLDTYPVSYEKKAKAGPTGPDHIVASFSISIRMQEYRPPIAGRAQNLKAPRSSLRRSVAIRRCC